MAPEIERKLIVAADFVSAAVEQITALRPRSLVLSGGKTPVPVYERLAGCDLPWPETEIFFADERCVPPSHPDSNFRSAKEAMLSKVPARVHRMRAEICDPTAYEREIKSFFGEALPAFDLVILGLGADGHTASLFPGDKALDIRDRSVAHVERPDHSRLTLTLPVLSAAKTAIFLVAGSEKRTALRSLVWGDDIPAGRVAAKRTIIVADEAAGAGLGIRPVSDGRPDRP